MAKRKDVVCIVHWENLRYCPQPPFAHPFLRPLFPLRVIIHGTRDKLTQRLPLPIHALVNVTQKKFHCFGVCPYTQKCFVSFCLLGAASYKVVDEFTLKTYEQENGFSGYFWTSDHLNDDNATFMSSPYILHKFSGFIYVFQRPCPKWTKVMVPHCCIYYIALSFTFFDEELRRYHYKGPLDGHHIPFVEFIVPPRKIFP